MNLHGMFSELIFRVPDFQRGYAWSEKQLIEIWDDLDEIRIQGQFVEPHYTGTIFLEKVKAPEVENWVSGVQFCNVIDGQQRLTTISILLYELISAKKEGFSGESQDDLLKRYIRRTNSSKGSSVYKFGYYIEDNKYSFLMKEIFEGTSCVLDSDVENVYTKNLMFAKRFFSSRIATLQDGQDDALFKKVTEGLIFDIRYIEKELDVQAVFETMNNRGKNLSVLERLKNRLIYLGKKKVHDPNDTRNLRNSINAAWKVIYYNLGKNPEVHLDEDIFLSAHLSLIRKPKEAVFSEEGAEKKVFRMFCNQSEKLPLDEQGNSREMEPKVSQEKIQQFVVGLSRSAPIWYQIHNSHENCLQKIMLLCGSKEIKVFLLSVQLMYNKAEQASILERVEKILFRNSLLGIGVIDERTLAARARDIVSGNLTSADLIQEFDIQISMPIAKDVLIRQFNGLFDYVYRPLGFHRWAGLKYFLYEYEEELMKRAKETAPKVSFVDYFDSL